MLCARRAVSLTVSGALLDRRKQGLFVLREKRDVPDETPNGEIATAVVFRKRCASHCQFSPGEIADGAVTV